MMTQYSAGSARHLLNVRTQRQLRGDKLPHIYFQRLNQGPAHFVRSISQLSASPEFSRNPGLRADAMPADERGTQTPAVASSAPARRDLTIPCGSSTNFFATPLSKSWYPRGASSNGNTSTLTALAIFTLSCRMVIISCRL